MWKLKAKPVIMMTKTIETERKVMITSWKRMMYFPTHVLFVVNVGHSMEAAKPNVERKKNTEHPYTIDALIA